MRCLALLLMPVALLAGPARYARLANFDGPVEVQLQASDAWMPAERNLPLIELAWIRTGAGGRVEIELDDGGVWRLGPESQGELSDYTRLSTGQRVTLLSLDHGLAYFTGKPGDTDSLSLVVPGAQAVLTRAARLRLEARGTWSQISVLEGSARFSSLAAEIQLPQGLYARVEPGNRDRFVLDRKIPANDLDGWNADRDKLRTSTNAQLHVQSRYGLADLDAGGTWMDTQEFGTVWQPKVAEEWAPFQKGRWRWYDTLGYTWVSDDAWGWLPYHYGRWTITKTLGWVWAPSMSQVFKPGDVFWVQGESRELAAGSQSIGFRQVGWGPLAPGERWIHSGQPEQLASRWMTFGQLTDDARLINPAGFTPPESEPLRGTALVAVPPSPTYPVSRLDALRPVVQAGSTRLKPVLPGVTYGSEPEPVFMESAAPPPALPPTVIVINPPAVLADPDVVAYPVPVLAGILTATLPSREGHSGDRKSSTPPLSTPPVKTASNTAGTKPPPMKPPSPDTPPRSLHGRELDIYNRVVQSANEPPKLLDALDTWTREFPHTVFADERNALYVQAYAGVRPSQASKAMQVGTELLNRNLENMFPDPQRGPALILGVLYSMTLSSWNIPKRSPAETVAGLNAAGHLLDYAPIFFAVERRPQNVTAEAWKQARMTVVTTAEQTVALLRGDGGGRGRGAKPGR